MEHYVTIFDSLFLPQGLALHQSLLRHGDHGGGGFTLWVVCVDDQTCDVLTGLQLAHLRPLRLSQLEDQRLKQVKPGRGPGEYCWTLTPYSFKFVFEADPTVQRVTYLDADMWLRQSPAPVFKELEASGKSVLITEHAYSPEYDHAEVSGQYCVQFLTIARHGGEAVRQWWEDRCIEWCFARAEDGKFGDQKYLDVWPTLFEGDVHVVQDKERFLAPWNVNRFPRGNAVAYHFHELRLLADDQVWLVGGYALPQGVVDHIYAPYLVDLGKAVRMLSNAGSPPRPQKTGAKLRKKSGLSQVWRLIRGKPLFVEHARIAPLVASKQPA